MKQGTKHTPGPWAVEGLIESNGVGAYRIVESNNTYAIADVYEIEGREPNARLIAAAPELLEALRMLINYKNAHGKLTQKGLESMIEAYAVPAYQKATGGAE